MRVPKAASKAATGLAGVGLAYGLWQGWGKGLERLWEKTFGPPDLGPVDFASLRRPPGANALVAPPSVCAHARADLIPPDFPVSAARLREIVAEVAISETNTSLVHADEKLGQDRYVARSRVFHFPDTIDVKIMDRGEGRSTLAMYSRSQVGRGDFGANLGRLKRWLQSTVERAGEPTPPSG
jgi:uncharacterized protein (DUF1499 family)